MPTWPAAFSIRFSAHYRGCRATSWAGGYYAIGALSGALAGTETESLIEEFTQGRAMSDVQLIARLSSLIVAALRSPLPDESQLSIFATVLADAGPAESDAAATADGATAQAHEPQTI